MLQVPILRGGAVYESVDRVVLVHHATGEPVAQVSQANSGLLARDIRRMADDALEAYTVAELIDACRRAGEAFVGGVLPLGEDRQTFDDYLRQLSATTGMPITYCRNNAQKIHKVLTEMEVVLGGLTRRLDPGILDRGFGSQHGGTLSYFRVGRIFGAVLPSNSPGVHSLWVPAVALKAPVVLKPGREEPWTPYRIIQAFLAAGLPAAAFGFYPTDHGGAAELLRNVDRAMLFGDAATTRAWQHDTRVQIHGPGYSKVILGEDTADDWERYLDVMATSIAANGGRSCINASAVWTPRRGRSIAEGLAQRLGNIHALPANDPQAQLAAFADPKVAERISAVIDADLRVEGAEELTQVVRGAPRLERLGRCAYLLPTIVWCSDREHPLANREFLFPFASVVECPVAEIPHRIGPTLVGSAITQDARFRAALMSSRHIDRLNFGPIPTAQISWDQPHEGNLFEHLYRQRAFQIEPAA
ncbi:MAG: aldehyde dehydrogenase family protein [Planctomycetes bacterium]|nr:aldehyde dehydrogenase family protein [Planctomycetota bacterium]